MNDIKKLEQVIDTLEKQSIQVGEFSGVLALIKDTVNALAMRKNELDGIVDSIKENEIKSERKMQSFEDALSLVQNHLAQINQSHDRLLKELSNLNFLTPEQFRSGFASSELKIINKIDNLQEDYAKKISSLNYLTPEKYNDGRLSSDKKILNEILKLNSGFDAIAARQKYMIAALRILIPVCVLSFSSIAFLLVKYFL